MSASSVVHSNAFNFMGFLQHSVDPRTGQYVLNVELPELKGNRLSGPNLPLPLRFSPLNTLDTGFGLGWTLNLSQYTPADRMLALSSGATYKVEGSGSEPTIPEKKLDSFHFFDDGNGTYRVVHKSGLVEILQTGGSGDRRIAVPRQIFVPSGHALALDYVPFEGGQLLHTVSDAYGTLLRVERDPNNFFVKLHLHPDAGADGGPLASFEMKLDSDNRVREIVLPTDEQASWRFQYLEVFGLGCLIDVQTPTGGRETIEYLDQGHAYPVAGRNPLPRATRHRVDPGFGQPIIEVAYSYTDNNFIGNNASINWDDDGLDNLYKTSSGYEYGSVATLLVDGHVERTVTRTFSRFHLLTEERTLQGHSLKRVRTDYYAEDKHFSEQPAQFQLPKKVTTTWELDNDATYSRRLIEHTVFDENGNLTEQIQANGTRETFEYYPAEGAGDDCPPDPYGFVRQQREKITYPAPSEHGDAPVLYIRYRYQKLSALSSAAELPAWLVLNEETLDDRATPQANPLKHSRREYYDTPNNPDLHGRTSRQSETLQGHTTTVAYAYSTPVSVLAGEAVKQIVETTTGFDGTQKVFTVEQSLLTGKPLIQPDASDVNIQYHYDRLGRLTGQTVAPGTVFEASTHYAYTLATLPGQQASQVFTDVTGIKTRSWFDGANRTIREERQDPANGNAWRTTYTALHNALDQRIESTDYDWLDNVDLPLTEYLEYDDWGEICKATGPDGVATITEMSPFGPEGVIQTVWQESSSDPTIKSGKSITQLNLFDKPVSIIRQDEQEQTVGELHYHYDGNGNCVEQQQHLTHATLTTGYRYDVFGRLFSTQLPDQTQVERRFAEHTIDELPVSITVTPADSAKPAVTVGQQRFDGLQRLTETKVGPRVEQYCYTEGEARIRQRTTPGQQVFDYTYTPALTDQPTSIQLAGNPASRVQYTYHNQTAQITSTGKSATERENEYQYDNVGYLQLEKRHGSDGKTREHCHHSSRNGLPITGTPTDGLETCYTYDPEGRLKTVQQDRLQCEHHYNPLGQLSLSTTRHLDNGLELATQLTYDSLGREVERVLSVPGQPDRVLTQQWYDDDQLHVRELQQDEQSLSKETFVYDARARLLRFSCSGSELPLDSYGNRIANQAFEYDSLDNIQRCVTTFADRSRDDAHFTYASDDACQLLSITHTGPGYPQRCEFSYDADGHLLNDEQGRQLSYTPQGRLREVRDAGAPQPLLTFRYDGHDELIGVQADGEPEALRVYQGYQLSHVFQANTLTQCLYAAQGIAAQQQAGDDSTCLLLLDNDGGSVIGELSADGTLRSHTYGAYGETSDDTLQSLLGFNGEVREPNAGWYLLGRGYRAYNPALMRFHSPDSASPFGEGGLNPYMYCQGNPVSFSDPTGHQGVTRGRPGGNPHYIEPIEEPKQSGGWMQWLGVGIAALFLVVSIVSIPFSGGMSVGLGIALAGVVLQVAGIGMQVAGVLNQDDELNTIGYVLGAIGGLMTGIGASMARTAVKKAAEETAKLGAKAASGGWGSVAGGRTAGGTFRADIVRTFPQAKLTPAGGVRTVATNGYGSFPDGSALNNSVLNPTKALSSTQPVMSNAVPAPRFIRPAAPHMSSLRRQVLAADKQRFAGGVFSMREGNWTKIFM